MQNNTVLVTNNEELSRIVRNGRFVEGSSLDVLVSVRSSVHLGGRLLTHPLCGNLRPYQQPFRSVLIQGELMRESLERYGMLPRHTALPPAALLTHSPD